MRSPSLLVRAMYRALLCCLFAAAVSSGCGGCEDRVGTNTPGDPLDDLRDRMVIDTPKVCEDTDLDGFFYGNACEDDAPRDCNDANAADNPNAQEVCGDGRDNNCDGQVDEGCFACEEGATRPCSADVGECRAGVEECIGGAWAACSGVVPSAEVCDGKDNDCDGEVDEDPQALCDDGLICNGSEVCQQGACAAGEALDCAGLTSPCAQGVCDEKAGGCQARFVVDGTACDDGLFCTEDTVCQAGQCLTSPRDCSGVSDQCNTGVCDEALDACMPKPISDGTTCDDGAFCTTGDVCQAGVCAGAARDCSGVGDQCNIGACDEQQGACVPQPVTDGTACDDGAFCNTGEACQAGVCTGGAPRVCGAGGGSCRTGTCDEATDQCTGEPVADGTTCDDGLFCTTNDACQAGACVGGAPTDCSGLTNQCNTGACDETLNRCAASPRPNGTMCDDGAFCTTNDSCQAGACTPGAARACPGDACNSGVCDEAQDACALQPVANGTACSDGAFCTVGDACQSGACVAGAARVCAGDQCNSASCDEAQDACVVQPVANGTACSDGAFCTVGDACQAGACAPGMPRTCPGSACQQGTCDEGADQCRTTPRADGTACDDGRYCTAGDACQAGACVSGAGDTCAGAAMTPCTTATCDEAQNTCVIGPDPACCDASVDADLDGINACNDCDDNDGSIYPGATERCDGLDNDCDGQIDEDFDSDGDGFGTCSQDPLVRDCDDARADTYPGAPELCDGRDNDCDGYIDEGCPGCSNADADGDGVTGCQGDCDDTSATTYPGAPELCDGKDNDCNQYTRPNCGVSQPCNFDQDGDPSDDQDVCQDDMICACALSPSGSCTGNYLCTSFCNSSDTGGLGDGCQPDQFCSYDLLYSANIHGCAVTTSPIAASPKRGGEPCDSDAECRSLSCDKICNGQGCNQKYCQDWCASDDYCGPNAVCALRRTATQVDGRCLPASAPTLGASAVGATCASDSACDHGMCAAQPSSSVRRCAEACCQDSDCPGGFTCSLAGDGVDASVVYSPPGAPSCTTNASCAAHGGICNGGKCAWRIRETSPMCIPDVSGQGNRTAGQACASNTQCASNFCERDLGVCVEVCCSDNDCPFGQTCEKQFVESGADRATQARICVNTTSAAVLRRK